MSSRTCRLCRSLVAVNHCIALFSRGSAQQRLSTRITDLLDVSVDANDGLPQGVCEKCKRRLEHLEFAAQDLVDFRKLARDSYTALVPPRGPLKRTKESSGEIGVSPDIAKSRPPLKKQTAATSKRLDFGQSALTDNCK